MVELEHLSPRILSTDTAKQYLSQQAKVEAQEVSFDTFNLQEMETKLILQALKEAGGRKARAAELLGITREGLRKKLLRIEGEQE